ncbi:MAG: LysM peptidoglycan-binding domain-containing protein [Firmicutes bacterium]|nr:LysM peptidoglycan-binding domain-containing protein [Bacillota bacterium]
MTANHNSTAMQPVSGAQIPSPPTHCAGQLYTVKAGDSLFLIGRKFGVSVEQLKAANPQIKNPDIIFIGQVICIPTGGGPTPPPDRQFRVLSLRILSEKGQPLPKTNNAVQLPARVIVRATFTDPVQRAFFFLEPTGTGACENARLIGIDCPSATQGVAEIIWKVPSGTLGRVFVVACRNSICAKSEEILVVRNSNMHMNN